MQVFTANAAKTHFGEFIDKAQKEPCKITRRGRTVGVLVSEEEYEAMRHFYANRLLCIRWIRRGAKHRTKGLMSKS